MNAYTNPIIPSEHVGFLSYILQTIANLTRMFWPLDF